MITDPKTTVHPRRVRCAEAFAVALVEMILRLERAALGPYDALSLVGPAADALEPWWAARRRARMPESPGGPAGGDSGSRTARPPSDRIPDTFPAGGPRP